ncbi:hypothetical protein ACSQ67_005721 [Phaseolus vulgaris]
MNDAKSAHTTLLNPFPPSLTSFIDGDTSVPPHPLVPYLHVILLSHVFNKLLRVVAKKTLRVNSDELPHRTVSSSDSVPFPFLNPRFSLLNSPFAGFSTVSLRLLFRSRIDFSEFESEFQLNRRCSISFP